jgi:hypothetical protein
MYTTIDDELYDELCELEEQRIIRFDLWEDSLLDALDEPPASPEQMESFDIDLYLEDGIYFELYGVAFYTSPQTAPLQGAETIQQLLESMISKGFVLQEVAADEEDALVLVCGLGETPAIYLNIGGWLLQEWDDLLE